MVEAAGRLIPLLSERPGLCLHPVARMRGVLSASRRILVRARRCRFGASMSLYRAGLRLALFLPLGVAMPPSLLREVRQQGSPM